MVAAIIVFDTFRTLYKEASYMIALNNIAIENTVFSVCR